ncbi:MAG: ATP-binding protein [Bacteroidales bacterium]|nr:ATP-binding protein [Bacteroidales bacterium]
MMETNVVTYQVDRTQQKEKAANAKSHNILEAFEYIAELAEDSNLDDEFLQKAAPHIQYASKKLKLSDKQVILLALFVEHSNRDSVQLSDLAEYIGCRTTKLIGLTGDMDYLEELHYIRVCHRDEITYRIPAEVLLAIQSNKPYKYKQEAVTDTQTFFNRVSRLMRERRDDELTYDNLRKEVFGMLDKIKQTRFAKALNRRFLFQDDKMIFILMAHRFVEAADDNIPLREIRNLFGDDSGFIWIEKKRELRTQKSKLFELELIESVNEDGMICPDRFKLTEKAKNEALVELDLQIGLSEKGLIQHDTLSKKHLIYNVSEKKQIEELSAILSPERFNDIQTRLREAGMRPGFCCLFYGAPGTGKTETVYQLARQTQRNILRVDVDKIKSCWVGESEKNIKMLFDRYRNICKNSKVAPILLFNEADAVLGVRQEGAAHAVDKMENSLQNIILQEMETLEGIMIATTNLTANLDKAFERRFLYKVKYEKPTDAARAQIWKTMLPGLNAEDAHTLSSEFDLSGGEIENVVRKHTVNAILSGQDGVDLQQLKENCRLERLNNNGRRRIGF